MTKKYTRMTPRLYRETLVARFYPLANQLRDLVTRFGLRTYRVLIVVTRWSGGERGLGAEFVVEEREVLPNPKVNGIEGLIESVEGPGTSEVGTVTVERINPDYTEAWLRGFFEDGSPLTADMEVHWEIELVRKEPPAVRRRFALHGAPKLSIFGWTVNLERAQSGDRTPQGDLPS